MFLIDYSDKIYDLLAVQQPAMKATVEMMPYAMIHSNSRRRTYWCLVRMRLGEARLKSDVLVGRM